MHVMGHSSAVVYPWYYALPCLADKLIGIERGLIDTMSGLWDWLEYRAIPGVSATGISNYTRSICIMFSKAALYETSNIALPATQHYDMMTKLYPEQRYIYPPQAIPAYPSTPIIPARTHTLHSCNLTLTVMIPNINKHWNWI